MEVKICVRTEKGLSACNGNNFTIADLTPYCIWVSNKALLEISRIAVDEYGILFNIIDGDGDGGVNISKFIAIALPNLMLQMQSNSLFNLYPSYEKLRFSLEQLNTFINNKLSKTRPIGWFCPALTAAIIEKDMMYFAQIGDTKAYLVRDNDIYEITKEQNLIRQLVDSGQISEVEAKTHTYKNVILQALGATLTINVIISGLKIVNGDIILLCTNKIIDRLELNDIKDIVVKDKTNLQSVCDRLIKLALIEPSTNLTVMLIEVQEKGLSQQTFEQMMYIPVIELDKNIPNALAKKLDFNIIERIIE